VVQRVASTVAGPDLGTVATPSERNALLAALRGWHATLVVVPVSRGPNTSGAARDPAAIARWLTSVLGAPRIEDAAWVWTLRTRSGHR